MAGFDLGRIIRSRKREVRGDGHHHGHANHPDFIVIEVEMARFQPRSSKRLAQKLVETMQDVSLCPL
jgi:hypothetical protein